MVFRCRYCKINFDHWEKLVIHRSHEHRSEFEALKSAFLRRKLEGPASSNSFLQSLKERLDELSTTSVPLQSRMKMKPVKKSPFGTSKSAFKFPLTPRKTPTKALDAGDLGDQEISLCVPTSTIVRSTSPVLPEFILSSPSSSTSNPFRNGILFHSTNNDFLTPPASPMIRSPLKSGSDEVSRSSNGNPPGANRGAVFYSKLSETEELQLFQTPSPSGSTISVITHPARENSANGESDEDDEIDERTLWNCANHVVIEDLDDELQISCSTSHLTNGIGGKNLDYQNLTERFPAKIQGTETQVIQTVGLKGKRLKHVQKAGCSKPIANGCNQSSDMGPNRKKPRLSSKDVQRKSTTSHRTHSTSDMRWVTQSFSTVPKSNSL